MRINLNTENDLMYSHDTMWGQYVSHSYDVDIGEDDSIHIIEELIDFRYAYFKGFCDDCKALIVHEFCQPRNDSNGRFEKNVEIVGVH